MKQTLTKLGGALFVLLFLVTSSAQATITATWNWKGNTPSTIRQTPEVYRSTAWVPSDVSGISMFADATGDNAAILRSNESWAHVQFNAKTKLQVPVVSTSDVVTVLAHSSGYNGIIIGDEDFPAGDPVILTRTHTATEADVAQGYVVIESKGGYLQSVQVELAYMPASGITANWDWVNSNPASISSIQLQQNSGDPIAVASDQAGISLYFVSGKLWANGSVAQFNNGTILRVPVTSTADFITVAANNNGFNEGYRIGEIDYTTYTNTYRATSTDVEAGYVEIVSKCSWLNSIKLEKHTTATIGSIGWATFSNDSATDFTNLAGVVDAYQVTGNSGSAITKAAVTTVAANTGLLLNAAAGTYAVPLATTGTDLSATNKLVAVASSTAVGAAPTGYTNFVLVGGSGTASFKKITGGNSATVGAGKAYLKLAGDSFAPQLFFDDDVTAINKVETKKVEDGVFYNLAGQQVAQPTKGLYIVNGKKVVIK